MKIILIRHGEAESFRVFDKKVADKNRKLTPLGHKQANETASYILNVYQPDMLVSSPYVRAMQTLESFTELMPHTRVKTLDYITPADDAKIAIKKISDEFEGVNCLVVVCHMPIVANIAATLVGDWAEDYCLAEARVIDTEVIAADLGTLVEKFIPNQYE